MPQPTNTFDTYDSIGNREDLSDIITMLDTTQTPFMSAIGKTKASAKFHEWQTDVLAAGSASNAVIEGDDATLDAVVPTVRLGNRTQILDKTIVLSGTQEAINKAGRSSEMAYQKAKKTDELMKDLDAALCANQAAVTGDSSTASRMAGYEAWITSNDSRGAGGSDPTLSGGQPNAAAQDGTQRALTEDLLQNVMQSCYDNGGEPSLLLAGSYNRRILSNFAGNATVMVDAKGKSRIATVDVYVSDFGELKIMPSRQVRSRSVLVVDPKMWKLATLRPTFFSPLAKTGDSEKGQIIIEATLECNNQASSGIIADLTTA